MTILLEGFPDDNLAIPLDAVDMVVEPGEHPYVIAEREGIAASWALEHEANPHLYDGTVVLQRAIALKAGVLVTKARVGPFSAILHWRRQGRHARLVHLFGMALVLASDGRLMAIRMANHTANPGLIYCPAGSLDQGDVVDGRIDLDDNMRREVAEETGLVLSAANADPQMTMFVVSNTVIVTRIYRLPLTASEIERQVRTHMMHDHEQEISDIVFIGPEDPSDPSLAYFMPAILGHLFI